MVSTYSRSGWGCVWEEGETGSRGFGGDFWSFIMGEQPYISLVGKGVVSVAI